MQKHLIAIIVLIYSFTLTEAQNLPSLLTGKNINATFSIVAYDEAQKEWGIAVATNNIYVGNSTIYIEPGVGAFSVIAETEPKYGINGLYKLKEGKSIKEAILFTKEQDKETLYRQVSGIDKEGNGYAFTGKALKYWSGNANHLLGDQFVVMGNQLDESVLSNMAKAFENSRGTLAERLLKSLIAGQVSGGQISGKQSAALVVKGVNNEWFNQIDLRVDHAKEPFQELQTLLNYHYGRIRINQAKFAHQAGNMKRAREKLGEAEVLLNGWNGMYGRVAYVNSLIGKDDRAIEWIKRALLENPSWKINLPAFYYLRENRALANLIQPDRFSTKNWEEAIQMLIRLNREKEAIEVIQQVFSNVESTSYVHYLLGLCYHKNGDKAKAILELEKAVELDQENVEAEILLKELKN